MRSDNRARAGGSRVIGTFASHRHGGLVSLLRWVWQGSLVHEHGRGQRRRQRDQLWSQRRRRRAQWLSAVAVGVVDAIVPTVAQDVGSWTRQLPSGPCLHEACHRRPSQNRCPWRRPHCGELRRLLGAVLRALRSALYGCRREFGGDFHKRFVQGAICGETEPIIALGSEACRRVAHHVRDVVPCVHLPTLWVLGRSRARANHDPGVFFRYICGASKCSGS